MGKRKKNKPDNIDFWQSSSDLMTALLLILLLIILLLILYLMRIPDKEFIGYHDGEFTTEFMSEEEPETQTESETETESESEDNSSGGGGGSGGGGDEETEPHTELEEYPYEEEGYKSAVFVMVIDGDTQKLIKEAGITFKLYSEDKVLQVLNTYYPEKITFKDFATTEDGTFFLPEKIPQDAYFFRNITPATGYDLAEDAHFVLDDLYDWDEPFVVKIPAFPSSNIIRIKMIDQKTKEPIPGGSFDVIPKEDVITLDGTLRYKKGEIGSTIICDENGYGESEDLYLGEYILKQKDIPPYYAGQKKEEEIVLERKTESEEPIKDINNEKNKITLTLTDELSEEPIKGAVYEVSDSMETNEYTTDASGKIEIDEVTKGVEYVFTQKTAVGDYRLSKEPLSIKVPANGLFPGKKAEKEVSDTNRIIRVNIHIKDAVFGSMISDTNVAIYKGNQNVVKSWTTNGSFKEFTDLEPGEYTMVVGGKNDKSFSFEIEDIKDIQNIDIKIYTMKSYIALVAGTAAAIGVLAAIVMLIKKLRAKRRRN